MLRLTPTVLGFGIALLSICGGSLAQTATERPIYTLYGNGMTIPDSGAASIYPDYRNSALDVLPYTIADKVTVTLHGLTHSYPHDVWVLLTHEAMSQAIVLMGGCGGDVDLNGVTLTFDPEAGSVLPNWTEIHTGTYRPIYYGTVPTFPAPAPAPPYLTTLADLRGQYPGIGWNLWVYDASTGDLGKLDAWSMTVYCRTEQAGAWDPVPFAIADAAKADRYPSSITVQGLTGPVEHVWVRLGLQHSFAADIDLLLTAPDGTSCIIMSDCGGPYPVNASQLNITDDSVMPIPEPITDPGFFHPTDLGGVADVWPAPAPLPPYGTALSVFNGRTPNGTWRLWAVDDAARDTGSINYWLIFVNGRVFCSGDFNRSGAVSVQDIFDFLSAYFSGCP